MAELIAALSVIASVAQLADYGFKLSVKLYSYSEAVYTADRSIKSISNDVSLTSTVLQELSSILRLDEDHVVSENAILATRQTVEECLKIFNELDEALSKSLANMGKLDNVNPEKPGKVNKGAAAFERMKWPFKQSKMELLRSNLDRLKASLTLMLQVLSYARDVASRKQSEESIQYQKQMIERLAKSERVMKQRYYALQHALEEEHSRGTSNPTINNAVIVSPPEYDSDPADEISSSAKTSGSLGEILLCLELLQGSFNSTLQDPRTSEENDEILLQALTSMESLNLGMKGQQFSKQPISVKVQAIEQVKKRLATVLKAGGAKEVANMTISYEGKEYYEDTQTDKRSRGDKRLLSSSGSPNTLRPIPGEYPISRSNSAPDVVQLPSPYSEYKETETVTYVDTVPFTSAEDVILEPESPDSFEAGLDSDEFRKIAEDMKERTEAKYYRADDRSGKRREDGKTAYLDIEKNESDDEYEHAEDEMVLEGLLKQWTTLPAQE